MFYFLKSFFVFSLFFVISILSLSIRITPSYAQTINGAGATFPYPLYSKWFSEYQKNNSNVRFNYQAIGSGGGIKQLLQQTVSFAASDAPLTQQELAQAPWPVLQIPTILGAVVLSYNLGTDIKNLNNLKMDANIIAGIMMGKITDWSDAAIKKLNPGLDLPAIKIMPIHRADGSGTTYIFTDFLSAHNKEWNDKVGKGKNIKWTTGIGAKGNDGVTALIKQMRGSFGYVELAYAVNNNLNIVAVQNKSGQFVSPNVESIGASAPDKNQKSDLMDSLVSTSNPKAYPLSSFSYFLIPEKKDDTTLKIKNFIKWALKEGQVLAPSLHYAPLPSHLIEQIGKKM